MNMHTISILEQNQYSNEMKMDEMMTRLTPITNNLDNNDLGLYTILVTLHIIHIA